MIIKNIDIANLKKKIRINKYCIEKYGCLFSDLSDLERKKVAKEIKNNVVKVFNQISARGEKNNGEVS